MSVDIHLQSGNEHADASQASANTKSSAREIPDLGALDTKTKIAANSTQNLIIFM